ncbi:hypothetical protein EVAR_50850_1 [Eumeta japonica]|uniref:Uncharacterized protein n=1 Tax=Eumeta variegata TaxID=151549 RepID=A0A4C1XD64_EUMVA|nr:hypothetical protein EVAR_50850_1 [Eumeta japonica]
MRLEPVSDDRPSDVKKTTIWKKVSLALEKNDTLTLKKIPSDIVSTNHIYNVISHITTVIENNSWKVPVHYNHQKLPADVSKLMRAKNTALRRASVYPTPAYTFYACALQCKVWVCVREVRNDNWSAIMEENTLTHKTYWHVAKVLSN